MKCYVLFLDTSSKKHVTTKTFSASTVKAIEASIQKFIEAEKARGYQYKVYNKEF